MRPPDPARAAKAFLDVLELAEELPGHHERELRFPRLPSPTADPESPLGEPVPGWGPVPRPVPQVLEGATARAEPLDPAVHAAGLFCASHSQPVDSRLWGYLPYGPFADKREFREWLGTIAPEDDPLFFALVDAKTQAPFGMASFLRGEPAHGSIEIGHIWIAGTHQRTRQATEALYLLIRHALGDLGYRRLEWICDSLNQRSRRAAERLGFAFEGVFRQHRVVKGRNRDTAWFAIVDAEWPAIDAGFERWLHDDNFDAHGAQRASLADARERSGFHPDLGGSGDGGRQRPVPTAEEEAAT